jgi:hypothetical protein
VPLTPIQGLWVGGRLTAMERLSLRSFLAHGHPYHLYSYDAVPNLPAGAELRPAAEVLPASAVFRYSSAAGGSFAAFSNLFRYRLLHQRGGWWADTDVVCLRPFDFTAERVFASERRREGGEVCASCVLRAPAGDDVCADCWQQASRDERRATVWGATGPSGTRSSPRTSSARSTGGGRRTSTARSSCPTPPMPSTSGTRCGAGTVGPRSRAIRRWRSTSNSMPGTRRRRSGRGESFVFIEE